MRGKLREIFHILMKIMELIAISQNVIPTAGYALANRFC
ncbi:TPA: hypothetical protein MEH79_004382 [Klebsiella quasipneumoniae subsp. similipneumoniae]|nr:hypothetical protein AKK42_09825 [Klebsiella quasipneumoniae]HBW1628081.1 hypothetical protein [Klebsiella quasipneumoniae subsp. similipneumoniae]ASR21210.1 hypothetical protein AWV58_10400 [Klebsiella quasipneumoniae]ASR26659.1 hypothetical protein AWV59_14040 [Klebsiella quasipneumoniae]ASR29605.1 hypothetical protein AWV60_04010 [Klebsiella quasipneumoniae]